MPNPFTTLTSRIVPLPVADIDTDQIIPARYLKVTSKQGLGSVLFADWRYDGNGKPKDFVLNRPEAQGANVLLAGDNFGCGSSREHAPWALTDFGFRVVISTSFADIFRGNALKNGLLPLIVDQATLDALFSRRASDPSLTVTIDVANQRLELPWSGPDGQKASVTFPIDAFSKRCLLEGIDELGYLLKFAPKIATYEAAHG